MQNYEYPLNSDWTTDEMVTVVNFLALVEQVYEASVDVSLFKQAYQSFKKIVTSISEEKRIDKQFQQVSGYSIYRAVQLMKAMDQSAKPTKMSIK